MTPEICCGITRPMIDINNITVRIGSRVLLEGASAHISDGWRVGLVGANGCGKTTLFRVLRGELETEQGEVSVSGHQKMVSVEQELNDTDSPILEFVLARDRERTELLRREQTADESELAEIHERLRIMEAASAPARAAEILHGLGFAQEDLSRPVKDFSGGWRMRLALAAALFQPSDILLLDEPTNHLDLEASLWLENHLSRYRGTLLIISHDRSILNRLCSHIIHFEHERLQTYGGNYDCFCQTRAARRELQEKMAAKQEQRRKHLQSFVDRFRYKASKAKQAQSRIKMLEKLETIALPEAETSTQFDFPVPPRLSPPLLTISGGSVGYDGKAVLQKLNLSIVDNDRIALLGANGNGKSTLAKLLSGRLPLLEGEMRASAKLKIGYFAQHQAEELPLEQTPLEYLSGLLPQKNETAVRTHLARFGLDREKALTRIEKLSGGEKARLLFAVMTVEAPALLILDEPTNHLDIDGRDALVNALNDYQGAVILITHDLHLLELVADNLWLVRDGTCRNFEGDIDDYRKMLLAENNSPAAEEKKSDGRRQREEALSRRSEINRLNGAVRRFEAELERLRERKTELENRFQEQLTPEEIVSLQKNLKELERQTAKTEEDWLTASERLEVLNGN